MKRIAVILARGGSKRIPRKNVLDVNGKPMLGWTVEAAIKSKQFDRVLVSTDDEQIGEIAKQFGAEVPFLRVEGADDITPSSEATLLALRQAESFWKEEYSVVAQLMANCPLRNSDDISDAVGNFEVSKASAQISCFKFGWMNPWWAVELKSNNQPEVLFDKAMKSRSQDLPDLYCPTGAIWLAKPEALRASHSFYTPDHIFHPMNWVSALDIDDKDDLDMANACFLLRKAKQASSSLS